MMRNKKKNKFTPGDFVYHKIVQEDIYMVLKQPRMIVSSLIFVYDFTEHQNCYFLRKNMTKLEDK